MYVCMYVSMCLCLYVWVTEFLGYADHGAEFVFGQSYSDHFFAFQVSLTHLQSQLENGEHVKKGKYNIWNWK